MRFFGALVLSLTIAAVSAAPALAQQAGDPGAEARSLTETQVDAALADRGTTLEQTRSDLSALLNRGEVQAIADEQGFDLDEAKLALGSLSEQQAAAAAPLMEQLEAAMRASNTITISVYTVIIILLLLILLT